MLKKISRYLGLVLGALTCLPLFVETWKYMVKVRGNSGQTSSYKAFDEIGSVAKIALGDNFSQFWLTLFGILTIVALVIAVVMIVVYVLDDLGVLKAQGLEKLLASLLTVVGIIALINVVICMLVNRRNVKDLETVYGLYGAVGAWLMPVFAIVGGGMAMYGVSTKSKKKKRK